VKRIIFAPGSGILVDFEVLNMKQKTPVGVETYIKATKNRAKYK